MNDYKHKLQTTYMRARETERPVWHAYGIVCALAERINYNALENYLKSSFWESKVALEST